MNFKSLHRLAKEDDIRRLAQAIISGPLQEGWNEQRIAQLVGSAEAAAICAELDQAMVAGFSRAQVGVLVMTAYGGRKAEIDAERQFELIFSGPQVEGARGGSTLQEFNRVVQSAKSQLLLSTYSFYKAHDILEPIAKAHEDGLSVSMFFNVSRNSPSSSGKSPENLLHEARQSFIRTWGLKRKLPDVYYFPQSLWKKADAGVPDSVREAAEGVGKEYFPVLHTKCIVADRSLALLTSANLSDSALIRNLEMGVLIKHKAYAEKICDYFDGAVKTKLLLPLFS